MGKPLDGYSLGQVVVSTRGKDAGHTYVIVGFKEPNRVGVADARCSNVSRPKYKNPKHVLATPHRALQFLPSIEGGKDINHGEFHRFMRTLEEKRLNGSGQEGR